MNNMRQTTFAIALSLGAISVSAQTQKSLPDMETLRVRMLEQHKNQETQRERYLCRVRTETVELDSKGNQKKVDSDEREIFFVKNRQITQTVTHNGRPLSSSDAKKEIDKVKKQIADAEAGKQSQYGISQTEILRLIKLTNERRIMFNGRPTILFDGTGDPKAKANGVVEKAVQAMEGTVAVDEASGHPVDTNVHGVRDVKVGGGLLANIHKGFLLHVVAAPRADGVWLVQEVWGSGDARVGLFMHPSYRFHQVTEGCRLFDVKADTVEAIEDKH